MGWESARRPLKPTLWTLDPAGRVSEPGGSQRHLKGPRSRVGRGGRVGEKMEHFQYVVIPNLHQLGNQSPKWSIVDF